MTTYLWPWRLWARGWALTWDANDAVYESPYSRVQQVVELGGERLRLSMSFAPLDALAARGVEGFLAGLRGRAHTVAVWDMRRGGGEPRGSLRGAPTLQMPHASGARVITLYSTAGATLHAGDMLAVGPHLCVVTRDSVADANGWLPAPIFPRLPFAAPAGTPVTWHYPCGRFRVAESVPSLQHEPGRHAGAWSIDLVQDLRPEALAVERPSLLRRAGDAALPTTAGQQLTLNGGAANTEVLGL